MSDEAAPTESTESKHSDQPVISVKVYAPFRIYFEGEARSVSGVNATGPFDILPHHHNFLCMLVPSELKISSVDGSEKVIKIHRALMHVNDGRVVVFVDV